MTPTPIYGALYIPPGAPVHSAELLLCRCRHLPPPFVFPRTRSREVSGPKNPTNPQSANAAREPVLAAVRRLAATRDISTTLTTRALKIDGPMEDYNGEAGLSRPRTPRKPLHAQFRSWECADDEVAASSTAAIQPRSR